MYKILVGSFFFQIVEVAIFSYSHVQIVEKVQNSVKTFLRSLYVPAVLMSFLFNNLHKIVVLVMCNC